MVSELCRFWGTYPDVFRRLISLSAVDPEARQVINSREHWRYQQVSTFVHRLADQDRLQSPFDAERASATVGAVTSFPACEELATRLHRDIDQLDELLIALLAGVVRLS